MGEKVEWPALLVLSRWDVERQEPVAFADSVTLHDDDDLQARLSLYQSLEIGGATRYTFNLRSVEDAHALVARLKTLRYAEAMDVAACA